MVGQQGLLLLDARHFEGLLLRVTTRYKHMGGLVDGTGSLLPELRVGQARVSQTTRPLRGRILKNPRISASTKFFLTSVAALPRLEINAATWPPLRKGEQRRYHTTVA